MRNGKEERFQSTGPLRDPTSVLTDVLLARSNFNPQVPCGTRPQHLVQFRNSGAISIHRSLAGPDADGDDADAYVCISIHRSLAGPDQTAESGKMRKTISIHRSLAGPDCLRRLEQRMTAGFQSTGPLRDPTSEPVGSASTAIISIHRSLAGPDDRDQKKQDFTPNFNPQVPCGTRRFFVFSGIIFGIFQSTGPLRDPTKSKLTGVLDKAFQSTGPLRDPTLTASGDGLPDQISIHRSLAGPDLQTRIMLSS